MTTKNIQTITNVIEIARNSCNYGKTFDARALNVVNRALCTVIIICDNQGTVAELATKVHHAIIVNEIVGVKADDMLCSIVHAAEEEEA